MSSQSRLIPVSYYNASQEVRLSAYADTIVYEREGPHRNILRAVRFGGYPEMVRGLADAIYAGGTLDANVGDRSLWLESQARRYRRQVTHDGVYAEATLLAIDDDQKTKAPESGEEGDEEQEGQEKMDLPPRKCIIFCPENDRDRLFEEVDRKTSVPLIPEFRDYVLDELERRGILKRLQVISLREKLDAWVLYCRQDDSNIISVVEDGLKSGAISIPGTVIDPDGFDGVENVTGYGKKYCHSSPTLDEAPLQRAIIAALNTVLPDLDGRIRQITEALEAEVIPFPGSGMSLGDIDRRLVELEAQFQRLLEKAVDDPIAYGDQFKEILDEQTALKELRAAILAESKEHAEAGRRIKDAAGMLENAVPHIAEWDESAIRQLVAQVKVLSKNEISVTLKSGIEIRQSISN